MNIKLIRQMKGFEFCDFMKLTEKMFSYYNYSNNSNLQKI